MNRAGAHFEVMSFQTVGSDLEMSDEIWFTCDGVEQRGLDGIDVNWLACYQKSAVSGFQHARASTRYP